MTMLTARISSRNQFGKLLNGRGLTDYAVEVGTHRGEFAIVLLQTWEGVRLYCVDHYPSMYDNGDPASYGDRKEDYLACRTLLSQYAGRVEHVLKPSDKASRRFNDGGLDFVYIDADHRYPAVRQDLIAWWPKVRPGGMLAGHDFVMPGEAKGGHGQGVQPAVLEFADAKDLDVYLVVEEDGLPWSFYMEKPKG